MAVKGKVAEVEKVKNGEVKNEVETGATSPVKSPGGTSSTMEEDKEQEKADENRDEYYHSAPPSHCKVKPQLSFLKFVKSNESVNISETPEESSDKEKTTTGNPADNTDAQQTGSTNPPSGAGGAAKNGAADVKKQLLSSVKVGYSGEDPTDFHHVVQYDGSL